MSYRTRSQTSETPIERIFQKVVHREMTPEERICLQLKPLKAKGASVSRNGAGLPSRNGAKLTRR